MTQTGADATDCVRIREATAADAAAIVPLVAELGLGFSHPPRTDEALVMRYLAESGGGILVAELDGEVVGFLAYATRIDLYLGDPTGEIVDVLVTEGARGRGVGTALATEAMRRFREAGCAQAQVITDAGNEPARRIYRKVGLVDELLCLQRHIVDDGVEG